MEKGSGIIALVLTFALVLFVAQRIGGIEWPSALVLLLGGALAAGFASSVGKRTTTRQPEPAALGGGIATVFRIVIGAIAITCMVTGGLWLVARIA